MTQAGLRAARETVFDRHRTDMAQPLTTQIPESRADWRRPVAAAMDRVPRRRHFPQAVLDGIGLLIAWELAVLVRVLLNPLMPVRFGRGELSEYLPPFLLVLALWMGAMAMLGLYQNSESRTRPGDTFRLGDFLDAFRAAVLAGVVTVLASLYFREVVGATISRSFAWVFTPVALAMLTGMRVLSRYGAGLWPRETAAERVAIVGSGAEAERVADAVRKSYNGSVRLVGLVAGPDSANWNGIPVLGGLPEVPVLVNRYGLDRLIVLDSQVGANELEQICHTAGRMGVVVSRVLERIGPATRVRLNGVPGLPMVEFQPVAFSETQELAKRVVDVSVSTLLLAALSPLMLAVAAVIKLTSEGPVLYRSWRVGRGGRYFTFLKFRSMYTGSEDRRGLERANEKRGHIFKIREDPRITPIGRFIRRFSIDELPQLINVLRGEMSLVGPRPLPACDLDPDGQSKEFAIWSEQRSLVPPGITGLWQVSGRSDLNFDKMVELDLRYVHQWSFWLDWKILLATPRAVVAGKGAY